LSAKLSTDVKTLAAPKVFAFPDSGAKRHQESTFAAKKVFIISGFTDIRECFSGTDVRGSSAATDLSRILFATDLRGSLSAADLR